MTPGTIGIPSPEFTYADFAISLLKLVRPPDTRVVWVKGMDVTANFNQIVECVEGDWLWILGHDHTFDPFLLVNLLSLQLEVVVPFCSKKQAPFEPVVYDGEVIGEDGKTYYTMATLPPEGVVPVHAAGSAGMLIRRSVLDRLERPIFQTSGVQQDEDLMLCRKLREEAGATIHCAVEQRLGHLGFFGVYPMWQGDRWGTIIDLGGGQMTPLFSHTPEELAAMEGGAADRGSDADLPLPPQGSSIGRVA